MNALFRPAAEDRVEQMSKRIDRFEVVNVVQNTQSKVEVLNKLRREADV